MGDEVRDLSGKLGLDTTDFKTAIGAANRELRVIESGFRASAAALGDWGNDASGLELRIKSLTSAIDIQDLKVKALQGEYNRVATEQGASSRASQDLQIKLNKETESLNKMQGELGQSKTSLDGLGKESTATGKEVEGLAKKEDTASTATDKLEKKSGSLGAALKTAGAAVTGLAVGVAGIGAGITKMVLDTANTADGLDEMSQKTGLSTERLQELGYVSAQVGTDTETVTGALTKLTRSMSTAQTETEKASGAMNDLSMGPTGEAFYRMGIAVTDSTGDFRDAQTVYKEAQKAISEIKNPVDRDTTAMAIFGTTFNQISQKTLPTLEKNMSSASDQIGAYNIKMSDLGANSGPVSTAFKNLGVSFTDASGNLRSNQDVFNDAITALGKIPNETERDAASMAIFGKSAQELNPLIKAGAEQIAALSTEAHTMGAVLSTEDVQAAADFHDQLDGLKMGLQGTVMQVSTAFLPAFSSIATKGGGYLKTFAAIVKNSHGDMSKMTSGVAELAQTIVSDIAAQAPQMLKGGLSIIQGIVSAIVASLPTLLPAVISMMTTLVTFLIQNIPLLLTAAVQILVGLANGLTTALPQLIPAIVQIIPQIITTLIDNLPLLIDASLQLIIALAQGLVTALPQLIAAVPQIVTSIMTTLVTEAPKLLTTAAELIKTLIDGVLANLPGVGEAAGKIIATVVASIGALATSLFDVGKSIVEGVWKGISSMASYFSDQVSGFFNGIVDGVKDVLHIHSPSQVFAGIGQNMALGLGEGFSGQFGQIERQINASIKGMSAGGMNVSGGAPGRAKSNSVAMGGVHIYVTGPADPVAIGNAAQTGVLRAARAIGAM